MDAREAREKSIQNNKQFNEIMASIRIACDKGEISLNYYEKMTDSTWNMLKQKAFKIQYSEYTEKYVISW